MDGKTPVTLLNEFLLKTGNTPDFSLILNGCGTHNPVFKYEVKAKGIIATGTGKSKKEAKHDAAHLLLLELKKDSVLEDEVDVISPYAHTIKENAVGALQDFCLQHDAKAPCYELIRDEGLAHAKIFGFRCVVSSFTTEAEARTKKQAKQLASHLMLLKLQKCLGDGSLSIETNPEDQSSTVDNAFKIAGEAFEKASKERLMYDKVALPYFKLGTSISNFSQQFLENILPLSETLQSIADFDDDFIYSHENPEELLNSIVSQLGYSYSYGALQSNSTDFISYVQIKELNYAHFLGVSVSEKAANRVALNKAIIFLQTMSKKDQKILL